MYGGDAKEEVWGRGGNQMWRLMVTNRQRTGGGAGKKILIRNNIKRKK